MFGKNIPDFRIEAISSVPSLKLPRSFNETYELLRPTMEAMGDEAPPPMRHQAAAHAQFLDFISSAPVGSRIASAVTCSGLGLSTGDIHEVYWLQPIATPVPVNQPIVRDGYDGRTIQGNLSHMGRMNGLFGWTKDRLVVAGALASYTHNFVAMLLGFFVRGKLPQNDPWKLPNMVLAETVDPKQFVLPASYTFQLVRPSLRTEFIIETSSSTPISLGFDIWDSLKNDVARIENVNIKSGDNRVVVTSKTPVSGYFTINPIDAPKGLVVKSINTIPMSI